MRTKRAVKLVFNRNSFKTKDQWKKDELRLFMNKAKGPLSSSNRPYIIKIFDLYSKKLIDIYKLSTKNYGWQTIDIKGWRDIGPQRVRYGRVGLKLVVVLAKKKLSIENTPFRKSKARREPYLVVFLQPKKDVRNKHELLNSLKNNNSDGVLQFLEYSYRTRKQD